MQLILSDVRFETYRSSGRVLNKSIKAIHVPTGITVECSKYNSMTRNKQHTLTLLEEKVRLIDSKTIEQIVSEVKGDQRIIDLLKDTSENSMIKRGNKIMYYDGENWVVRMQYDINKTTTVICQTDDVEKAIMFLKS